jgi:hypothetical protein
LKNPLLHLEPTGIMMYTYGNQYTPMGIDVHCAPTGINVGS